jgi:hypothetical protein
VKHIFLVHTPITYLVSISVIKELKLSKEDAFIIFHEFNDEAILENDMYTSARIEGVNEKKFFRKLYEFFRYFDIAGHIDKLIDTVVATEKFIAYVPVFTPIHKLLITHPNCISFNFIEEGLAHYFKEDTLETLNPLYRKFSWRSSIFKNPKRVLNEMYLVLRGYNFKLLGLPFSYSCYGSLKNVVFYGLTHDSYPLISNQKKVIISLEEKNFNFIRQRYTISLNDKFVWIGDPGVIHHGFSSKIYLRGIQEGCINFIKGKGVKNIYIKFHRDEPDNLREAIKKLFRDNEISIHVIPDSTMMELLLFEAKNVTLIGVYSSLLYYASIMRHKSFSIYNFLQEEYTNVRKRDFTFYWNKVELINSTVSA